MLLILGKTARCTTPATLARDISLLSEICCGIYRACTKVRKKRFVRIVSKISQDETICCATKKSVTNHLERKREHKNIHLFYTTIH